MVRWNCATGAGNCVKAPIVVDVMASAKYEANAKSQPTLLDLGKAAIVLTDPSQLTQ